MDVYCRRCVYVGNFVLSVESKIYAFHLAFVCLRRKYLFLLFYLLVCRLGVQKSCDIIGLFDCSFMENSPFLLSCIG